MVLVYMKIEILLERQIFLFETWLKKFPLSLSFFHFFIYWHFDCAISNEP